MKCLAADPGRRKKLNEISGNLKMNAGTCANIMKTLVQCGFVDQEKTRGGYLLGPLVYSLARKSVYRGDLVGTAEALMADLVRQVNESVLLVILNGRERSILIQINGNQSIQIGRDLFQKDNVYQTATGRLLLAHLDENALELFIAAQGLPDSDWPEAASLPKLRKALEAISRRGWECHKAKGDVMALAYPIRENGNVVAALGLFLPAFRFKGAHKTAVMQGLASTAAAISSSLSSAGNSKPEFLSRQET